MQYLLVPGYTNSGPMHWQSELEKKYSNVLRVEQDDWFAPRRDAWVKRLEKTVETIDDEIFLIGHSCGAVTIAQWGQDIRNQKVRGAVLVAPADVDATDAMVEIRVQRPMPLGPLSFRSLLICSDDDAHLSLTRAEFLACRWGSDMRVIPQAGHINTASGHGEWLEGEHLIAEFSDNVFSKRI